MEHGESEEIERGIHESNRLLREILWTLQSILLNLAPPEPSVPDAMILTAQIPTDN